MKIQEKPFILSAFFLTLALLAWAELTMVSGDFGEPSAGPPSDSHYPPIHTGPDYQEKVGNLGASSFAIRAFQSDRLIGVPIFANEVSHVIGCLSQRPPEEGWSTNVFCPNGYRLLSCTGTRDFTLLDFCDEGDCGYVGAVPIDRFGEVSTSTEGLRAAVGCRVGAVGLAPAAFAFCIRDEPCRGCELGPNEKPLPCN